MIWEFTGEAADLRATIVRIRQTRDGGETSINQLLDALLPAAITGSVYNHHMTDLDGKFGALLCGAVDSDANGAGEHSRCNLGPHDHRWHQERLADGDLWSEWSSVVLDDDEQRLWPDGHYGPRRKS